MGANRTVQLATWLILLGSVAMADDSYCSLRVNVKDPEGKPVTTFVSVGEQRGQWYNESSKGGTAEFCNLGLFPVKIKIGWLGCGQLNVEDVYLKWGATVVYDVIYDRRFCAVESHEIPLPVCRLLFRFFDADGKGIPNVRIETEGGQAALKSDEYGRLLLHLPVSKSLTGSAVVAGHQKQAIEGRCVTGRLNEESLVRFKRE